MPTPWMPTPSMPTHINNVNETKYTYLNMILSLKGRKLFNIFKWQLHVIRYSTIIKIINNIGPIYDLTRADPGFFNRGKPNNPPPPPPKSALV